MFILLVELGCLISGVQSTLRFAKGTGYTTLPSDTPANTSYAPHLAGCSFDYPVSADDRVRMGQGSIGVTNTDGQYDAILDYVYDNQTAKLLIVDDTAAYSTAKELARWTLEQPDDGNEIINFITRSPNYGLDRSIQTERFTGAGGLNGGAELTSKPMPLNIGPVINVKAVLVDDAKQIWQLNCGHELTHLSYITDDVITDVFDGGLALTRGADYTSVADMNANAPTGGDDYRVCNAIATGAGNKYSVYVRLDAEPDAELTWTGEGRPWGFSGTLYNQTRRILQALVTRATNAVGSIYGADDTATDNRFQYKVSLSFGSDGEPATYLDALKPILVGMRGWLVPYNGGPTSYPLTAIPYAVRWLETPAIANVSPYGNDLLGPLGSVTPSLVIDGSRIAVRSFKRRAEYEFGWPEFRTTLQYDRVWHLQPTGLLAGVSAADRQRLALEYLSASDEDLSVQTSYPTALDRVITTAWSGEVVVTRDMFDEAAYQNGVFSVHHPSFDIAGRADLYHAALTVPGDPVIVQNHARYGCDVSRTFLSLGLFRDYFAFDPDTMTIGFSATIWG